MQQKTSGISGQTRRQFLHTTGLATAGSWVWLPGGWTEAQTDESPKIKAYRTLGRTGFQVSDISMGCDVAFRSPAIIRYACDAGINYLDTAERYSNGASERMIGKAMPFLKRNKLFITTKLMFSPNTSYESLLSRFRACLQRLNTDYVDCLCIHSITHSSMVAHAEFHRLIAEMKAEGRVRFCGVSSHGGTFDGRSMVEVLSSAIADGRFDVMMCAFNFLSEPSVRKVFRDAATKKMGVVVMKTRPGAFEVEPFDPEHLTDKQKAWIKNRMKTKEVSREQAIATYKRWIARQQARRGASENFIRKYGIRSTDHLYQASVQWVLQEKLIHTACISMKNFETVDKCVSISGTSLSVNDRERLIQYGEHISPHYCRHGCNECESECPYSLHVNDVMRMLYYASFHRRTTHAARGYRNCMPDNELPCPTCSAPCVRACPFGIDIPTRMQFARSLLTSFPSSVSA